MNVESTKNQFKNKMSTIWVVLNLVMSLFALGFVDAKDLTSYYRVIEYYNIMLTNRRSTQVQT